MKTKKFLAVLIAFVFFISSDLFSQSKSPDSSAAKNSLHKGAWAVQFGIDKDFTLTNFSGASFTIKRHFSKNIALRFGVSLRLSDYDSRLNIADTLISGINGYENDFGFNLLMQYYLNPGKEFKVYFLAGPIFSYGYGKSSSASYNSYTTNFTRKYISAGGEIGFGAEYFVFRTFSLFAEYSAYVAYSQVEDYVSYELISSKLESSSTSFNFDNVRFGLSVYF